MISHFHIHGTPLAAPKCPFGQLYRFSYSRAKSNFAQLNKSRAALKSPDHIHVSRGYAADYYYFSKIDIAAIRAYRSIRAWSRSFDVAGLIIPACAPPSPLSPCAILRYIFLAFDINRGIFITASCDFSSMRRRRRPLRVLLAHKSTRESWFHFCRTISTLWRLRVILRC